MYQLTETYICSQFSTSGNCIRWSRWRTMTFFLNCSLFCNSPVITMYKQFTVLCSVVFSWESICSNISQYLELHCNCRSFIVTQWLISSWLNLPFIMSFSRVQVTDKLSRAERMICLPNCQTKKSLTFRSCFYN